MGTPKHDPDVWYRRAADGALYRALMVVVRIFAALPSRWVLNVADTLGNALYFIDARGRRIARQNLDAVYQGDKSRKEKAAIARAGFRESARAIALMLHCHPMTPGKFRRWVDMPEVEGHPYFEAVQQRGAVFVSAHIGNWEILLALRILYPELPRSIFVAETVPNRALNRFMGGLRGHGDLVAAMRKGGAMQVVKTVREGGIAAIVADRNVRGYHGGIYAPFLGLPARTTPLPAWMALRLDVPLHVILCLPYGDGRYRVWLGPDLVENLPPGTMESRQRELTARINHVLGAVVLAQPESWNWAQARFKGRPEEERGLYPPYSKHDP